MNKEINTSISKTRDSNLELYRIIVMILIIAHHFVVNSGLLPSFADINSNYSAKNYYYTYILGAWGKAGINCFLLITGYFMCTSKITLKKFLKLLLQIYFYKILIYTIFAITGYETISLVKFYILLMPIWQLQTNFTSCFIVFWLTIPFLNILIQNMTKKQHQYLLLLLLGTFSVIGTFPMFNISINYVFWFGIIYILAAYIRLYPSPIFENKKLWRRTTIISILVGIISIFICLQFGQPYYFLVDSNKILPVVFALSSFLYFKNLRIKYSKLINIIGGSTFGVLLIHANSDAMRTWLWKDFIDCIGHYQLPIIQLIGYSIGCILSIFIVCIIIDRIRIKLIEGPFFKWFDKLNINVFKDVK